jgi:Thioredoxin domain-containing protein
MLKEIARTEYEDGILDTKGPLLLYFWAKWDEHCLLSDPFIEIIADKYGASAIIRKVDVDKYSELIPRYRIRTFPTAVYLSDGREVGRFVGVASFDEYESKLVDAIG